MGTSVPSAASNPPTTTYQVQPTAPVQGASSLYTDISLTNLFNGHILTINSERQAIWQRFTAMLIGNSIAVGFIARGTQAASWQFGAGVSAFCLVLSGLWLLMTWDGYRHFYQTIGLAQRFSWQGPQGQQVANPLAQAIIRTERDYIWWAAHGVVGIFIVGYVVLLVHYLVFAQ